MSLELPVAPIWQTMDLLTIDLLDRARRWFGEKTGDPSTNPSKTKNQRKQKCAADYCRGMPDAAAEATEAAAAASEAATVASRPHSGHALLLYLLAGYRLEARCHFGREHYW